MIGVHATTTERATSRPNNRAVLRRAIPIQMPQRNSTNMTLLSAEQTSFWERMMRQITLTRTRKAWSVAIMSLQSTITMIRTLLSAAL